MSGAGAPRTGFRILAAGWVIEAVVLLGGITLVVQLLGWQPSPHPYGLAVLVVAAQHGTTRGALIAAIAMLLLLPGLPEQQFGEDETTWLLTILRDPLIWTLIVLLVGGLTDRLRLQRDTARGAVERVQRDLDRALDHNEALLGTNRALEAAIAARLNTLGQMFEMAAGLGHDEASVVRGGMALIRTATGAEALSIHLLGPQGLVLAGTEGETAGRAPIPAEEWVAALQAGRDCLVATRAEDRAILRERALLVAPVRGENDTLLGLVAIEAIPFRAFGIDTVASFGALCGWIGTALARARALREAEGARFLGPNHRTVGAYSSGPAGAFMVKLARRVGFDLAVLNVTLPQDRMADATIINAVLEQISRHSDLVLLGDLDGARQHVLLVGTDAEGARIVARRLRQGVAGHDAQLAMRLQVGVTMLHSVKAA